MQLGRVQSPQLLESVTSVSSARDQAFGADTPDTIQTKIMHFPKMKTAHRRFTEDAIGTIRAALNYQIEPIMRAGYEQNSLALPAACDVRFEHRAHGTVFARQKE